MPFFCAPSLHSSDQRLTSRRTTQHQLRLKVARCDETEALQFSTCTYLTNQTCGSRKCSSAASVHPMIAIACRLRQQPIFVAYSWHRFQRRGAGSQSRRTSAEQYKGVTPQRSGLERKEPASSSPSFGLAAWIDIVRGSLLMWRLLRLRPSFLKVSADKQFPRTRM